jgi:hypothetical protein
MRSRSLLVGLILAMIPKFITAATSIGHIIAPYPHALMEKAEQLARG